MKNIYRKYFLCCFLIFFLLKNIQSQTTLNRGDLAIVGINANLASTGALASKDEISFVCFKPITTGTEIQVLDVGYENCLNGLWSCGQEGGAKFTRTGATIPAGTVITFRNTSPYIFSSPDNGWSVIDLYVHPTNTSNSLLADVFNINANGDQIYFAQGGTWSELSSSCTINGNRTSPNATFPGNNGRILFGFSSSGSWLSQQQSSGESGLYPGMSCFSMAPTSSSAYNKYTGPLTAANQTTWISRISDPNNWSSYTTSALYASSGTNYAGGFNILINNGGDIPTATWTAPSGTICSNSSSINLNSLITGSTGGTWSGTGVTGSTFNPTGLNGTYQITYTVNYISGASSCPISQINSITVNANPPTFTLTGGTFCPNGTTLSGPSDPNYTYEWGKSYLTAPFTNLGNGQTQAISASGNYQLTVTNQFGCSTSATTAINVADYVFNGTLTGTDPTQTGRLNRFATISTCASPKACPGTFTNTGSRAYDSYTITNLQNIPVCATIGLNSGCGMNLFSVAYSGSFNPSNLCTNYLADPGSSPSASIFYEATIPANGTIVVVVHEVNPAQGCASYSLTVDVPRDASSIIVNPSSVSPNATSTLTAPVANSYLWTPGSAITRSITTPPLTNSTKYKVTLGYGNFGCSRQDSVTVIVAGIVTTGTLSAFSTCSGIVSAQQSFTVSGNGLTNNITITAPTGFEVSTTNGSGFSSSVTLPQSGGTVSNTLIYVRLSASAIGIPSGNITLTSIGATTQNVAASGTINSGTFTSTSQVSCNSYIWPLNSTTYTSSGTYVRNYNNTNGCASADTLKLTINSAPTPTVTTPITYCQNATAIALTATGTNLLWYTTATGGTGSATAPTPSTTTSGNTNYYVNQTVNGCASTRANITVTVNVTPTAPTVTTQISYCQNATATALTATGTNLLWYTSVTGGTGVATAPTPNTTTAGNTNYFVSQTSTSGCESPRANIVVTINATPTAPTVTTPISYCQNATATALTATGTNLLWYTTATVGSGSATAPTPNTTTSGITNYYVSQTSTSGCESPRANIVVTINATPAAPTITTPITYCQNASASALTATGTNLLWYNAATSGTGSATAPTPNTTTVGNTNYYVSQTLNGCESPRANIAVIINAAPTINAVSNQTVCTNTSTAPINFSGIGTNIFNWTNNNTVIGLAASGTGNIASFTALNSGTVPITATITATPVPSSFAYIANYGSITSFPLSNTVTVINTNTNAIAGTITVGSNPFGVSASSDGTKVYVTNYSANSVSVINTSTNTVVNTIGVGNQPMGIVVSPDGSRVYVANQLSNTLSVINTTTNTVVATIPISLQPQGVTISPDGSKVYVVNVNSNNVSVINTATNTVITTIGVGVQPITAAISPDGSRLYVTNFGSNNISIINTSTNSVITNLPVGFAPNGIAVTPDGSKVYVTNQLSGNVSIINTATNTLSATISVGSNPQGISFTADGSKAYVANFGSGNVSVINTNTNIVSATIAVGSVPHSLGNFISQTGICSGLPTTFTITVNPLPVATFTYPANIFCTVGTATPTITGTSGGTFSSSSGLIINATTGVINLAASTPGIYTITYTLTVGNCTITPTTSITINAIPNAPIVNSPIIYCQNTIATALSANGTNLLWYNLPNGSIGSNTSPTPSTTTIGANNYYVTQTINNCESPQATISVNVVSAPPIPTITPTGPIQLCTDTSSILYSSAATGNQWYKDGVLISGATNNSLLVNEVGNYTVKVTNSNGCSNISSGVSVAVFATPTVSAGQDKIVFQGDSVQLISTVSGGALFNYLWTPSIYLSDNTIANPWVKNPLSDTTYKLTVTNQNGCRASSSVKVKLLRDLKIPNVFSPNGDGLHDTWDITNLNLYQNSSVEIFNRNGQIVFQSKGYSTPWDGRKNGSPVPVGVYYYIINTGNGKPLKSGWLTILR